MASLVGKRAKERERKHEETKWKTKDQRINNKETGGKQHLWLLCLSFLQYTLILLPPCRRAFLNERFMMISTRWLLLPSRLAQVSYYQRLTTHTMHTQTSFNSPLFSSLVLLPREHHTTQGKAHHFNLCCSSIFSLPPFARLPKAKDSTAFTAYQRHPA